MYRRHPHGAAREVSDGRVRATTLQRPRTHRGGIERLGQRSKARSSIKVLEITRDPEELKAVQL